MGSAVSRRKFMRSTALAAGSLALRPYDAGILSATSAPFPGRFQPTWDSLRHYHCPQWFRDAKLGIFLHWGVYSVPAHANEWYPRLMYLRNDPVFNWHREHWGPQSLFGYKDFIPLFRAEQWRPDQLVELFRNAGARYIVPVGEHCDGFPMYNSHLTDWCAAKMGPGRDVVGEWARAVRNQGLKLGVSTHRNWHWSWYTYDKDFDTSNPLYAGLYGRAHPPTKPIDNLPHEVLQVAPPSFLEDWYARTTEIVNLYNPSLLWLEWGVQAAEFDPYKKQLAAYYYNLAEKMNEEVALTYKGDAFPDGAAVFDVERGSLREIREQPWQSETSISWKSWGYIADDSFKTAAEVLYALIDVVSKNGNLLLNVGPKPDGTLPPQAVDLFRQMELWMRMNGEAIFRTRPWKTYGEGTAVAQAGTFGERQRVAFTPADVRFTRKGNAVYAFLLAWPRREARIASLGSQSRYAPVAIEHVSLLGSDEKLHWTQQPQALVINVPPAPRSAFAPVFKIELKS